MRPGFLSRLRRDIRGNTLAMLAIALIPISALAGSAIDVARLYVVKVRLQQACDAGVLAGRKFMTDSTSTTLDATAVKQAKTFFANNYPSGMMGTAAFSSTSDPYPFVPVKTTDGQVSATATMTVPMTIMKMFKMSSQTLSVTCEARYDIADTDIMFVLDTTGSMACTASGSCSGQSSSYTRSDGTTGYYTVESSGSKIAGLRSAVLQFYDTMKANVDSATHVRYGFVTYSSAVNAGAAIRELDSSYLATRWRYQSRRAVGDQQISNTSSTSTANASSSTACATYASRTPALYTATDPYGTSYTAYTYTTSGTAKIVSPSWSGSKCTLTTYSAKPIWRYMQVPYDVSGFVAGNSVTDPSKVTGATTAWQGCIEERDTTSGASSFDVDDLPPDLDPDLVPSSEETRWRPMWQNVVYFRGNSTTADYSGSSTDPYGDLAITDKTSAAASYTSLAWANNMRSGYVSCGMPVQRLDVLTRDQVSAYVNATDFKAQGGTYHDTGMIWGTRLISPTGIFKEDTKAWDGRQPPNRYIVFMTDGDMQPNSSIYGMYGIERYDDRISGNSTSDLTTLHNARFLAECEAAKARNITVFVVGFGQTLTTQLKTCASAGKAYYASDNASLTSAFQSIAKQVALLRISQ